jgi:hypothetical protein
VPRDTLTVPNFGICNMPAFTALPSRSVA